MSLSPVQGAGYGGACPHMLLAQNGLLSGHTTPHWPQFFGSCASWASQPSVGSMLQSTKPALQTCVHMPLPQTFDCVLLLEHGLPHAPQASRLVSRFASHP